MPDVALPRQSTFWDCGYVVLDNMYRRRQVDELRDAYEALKAGPDGPLFRYPVQGAGRVEHSATLTQ